MSKQKLPRKWQDWSEWRCRSSMQTSSRFGKEIGCKEIQFPITSNSARNWKALFHWAPTRTHLPDNRPSVVNVTHDYRCLMVTIWWQTEEQWGWASPKYVSESAWKFELTESSTLLQTAQLLWAGTSFIKVSDSGSGADSFFHFNAGFNSDSDMRYATQNLKESAVSVTTLDNKLHWLCFTDNNVVAQHLSSFIRDATQCCCSYPLHRLCSISSTLPSLLI